MTVKPPWSVVPPVFIGSNFSTPLRASHMHQIVIGDDLAPVALRDVERIADVVAVAVREQDVGDALDRRRLVARRRPDCR